MHSERIPGISLFNTRDLGGLPAKDGRTIKRGRLLRSGALADATENDIAILSQQYHLRHVVDLRTDVERENHPNQVVPGSCEHFLPVLNSQTLGITRGQNSSMEQFASGALENFDPIDYMCKTYTGIVAGERGQQCYRTLFELMLECEDGALLWHCTVGKDRTGLGALFIEWALGVPENVIAEDYMATNIFNEAINARDKVGMLARVPGELSDAAAKKMDAIFEARPEYLQAAVDVIEKQYGGLDLYLETALGVTPEMRSRLCDLYLE